jgi:hypothetical protein
MKSDIPSQFVYAGCEMGLVAPAKRGPVLVRVPQRSAMLVFSILERARRME